MPNLDHHTRCEAHVGEVFPPRCHTCDDTPRPTFVHLAECPLHRGYPMPCHRCKKDTQ